MKDVYFPKTRETCAKLPDSVLGLNHVTAISGDPHSTINFYTGVLGLRLVKLTVNFDDPGTYHLYFGDERGHPGTILTFFPWPGQPSGHRGNRQVTSTSFSVPRDALQFWQERLASNGIRASEFGKRFGDSVLSFADIDGLGLELIASRDNDARTGWSEGPIPREFAIRGFHSVTLNEKNLERTESVLVDNLGFRLQDHEDNRYRYTTKDGTAGSLVDVVSQPNSERGIVAVGTVHHIAFRASDDDHQKILRKEILQTNPSVTLVIDRLYFHSIYFREPGGVLLEVATDPPGFTIDEPIDRLGSRLALPSWLESSREKIAKSLPPVRLPTIAA